VDIANGFGPAEAGADRGDEVVVAHEELVVVDVVHMVSVHNATLISAGKREALVGGANVSAARVKGAKLGLRKSRAWVATIGWGNLDVTSALLLGTEKTGAWGLASAGLGARAPRRPVGDHAIGGARLLVALSLLDKSTAGLATIVLGVNDGAAAPHLASATALVATCVRAPAAELAVHRARSSLAGLSVLASAAFLAPEHRTLGDLTGTCLNTLATGLAA